MTWRISAGQALFGLAACGVAVVAWWLAGWFVGLVALACALTVLALAVIRCPVREEHVGPFATPPYGYHWPELAGTRPDGNGHGPPVGGDPGADRNPVQLQ